MGDQDDEDINQSSIKPVSSLRSLFEGKRDPNPPPLKPHPTGRTLSATLGQREAEEQYVGRPGRDGRASIDIPRSSTPLRGSTQQHISSHEFKTLGPEPIQRGGTLNVWRVPAPSLSPPRSPTRDPPLVTVESPHSPPKHSDPSPYASASSRTSLEEPRRAASSRSSSPVGALRNFKIPSRSASPALDYRNQHSLIASSNITGAADPPKAARIARHAPMPPPINRAAKPAIFGAKPSTPTDRKTSETLMPGAAGDKDDDRISPFSTPPSESESLPDPSPPTVMTSAIKAKTPSTRPVRDGYFVGAPLKSQEQDGNARNGEHVKAAGINSIRTIREAPQPNYDESAEQKPNLPARRGFGSISAAIPGKIRSISPRPPPPPEPRGRKSMEIISSSVLQPSYETPSRTSMDTAPSNTMLGTEANSRFLPPPRRFGNHGGSTHPADKPPPMPARPSFDGTRDMPQTAKRGSVARVIETGDSEDDEPDAVERSGDTLAGYPDPSQANRRPPRFARRPHEIHTKYETKLLAVCGEFVCTAGYITRVWSLLTGDLLMSISHGETNKATAVAFRPAKDVEDEGKRLWLGMNTGELHEIDISTQSVVNTKSNVHHRTAVVKILRRGSDMWTIDEEGKWLVWPADVDGRPSLDVTPYVCRIPKGATFTLVVGSQLWLAYGKEISIYEQNSSSRTAAQILQKPLIQAGVGEVTAGAVMSGQPDKVYFGHIDGKVTIYSRKDFSCLGIANVSLYKISLLAGVGDYLWAGFNTGKIYVYDTTVQPWKTKKDWRAHQNTIAGIVVDSTSIWKLDRLQVVSLGTDNMIQIWDGMLEEDWLELAMQERDTEYCDFQEVTALVMTWNAGAAKPTALRHNQQDDNFFRELLLLHKPCPDILVFGFQELVDLEDKKVTARSLFKSSKKKEHVDHERLSHQYRAWKDYLARCIDEYMPSSESYTLLHTAELVGLFTCVFIKSSIRSRIHTVNGAEVKLGMGGLHGNKGALIVRFILDDSSICFINCHLAAGQRQTVHRNNDIAAIMEFDTLPPQYDSTTRSELFVGGGDGSMILDHEICILNGDLNYRIDAIPRDTVIAAVRERNLAKLLDRDQLLTSRRKNPGFRLRAFNENPITFAPTYKYDIGSDVYDTSEKKRAPAWCDRLLYRGVGKVKQLDYRRHEVRVSDHRPVSGLFKMRVKTVNAKRRENTRRQCEQRFEEVKERIAWDIKLDYLVNVFGLSKKEAERLLKG